LRPAASTLDVLGPVDEPREALLVDGLHAGLPDQVVREVSIGLQVEQLVAGDRPV
jgi:hypothetical protein